MDLTPDQLTRAAAALAAGHPQVVIDLDPDQDAGVLAEAVQAVADALWPSYIGQPRQPLASAYELHVGPVDVVGTAEQWCWQIVLAGTGTGAGPTVVATSEPYTSAKSAAFMGTLITGLQPTER